MTTLKDIAKATGYSVTAVSYALNGFTEQLSTETHRAIVDTAKRLNYVPNRLARSLRTSKTFSLGVVAEDINVFCSPQIVDGIGEHAETRGYNIVLNNLRLFTKMGQRYIQDQMMEQYKEQVRQTVLATLEREVDAYIYVAGHHRDVHDMLPLVKKPIVFVYCYSTLPKANWVVYDDQALGYMMTRHLIENGHRSIACITGPSTSVHSIERKKGYLRAIGEAGLSVDLRLFYEGDWEGNTGYTGCNALLDSADPPTAIFAFNDLMAQGVMQAAGMRGLEIPSALSVVGCDNMIFSDYLYPRLTTAQLPLRQMGITAAQFAIDQLEGNAQPGQHASLPCTIVQRSSVAHI